MRETTIPGTTLVVTNCRTYKTQVSLFKEEQAQILVVVVVTDTATGKQGHILMELETCKRDILHEQYYTDNPELFKDNHPEQYDLQHTMLSWNWEGKTPTISEPDNDTYLKIYDNLLWYKVEAYWVPYYDDQALGHVRRTTSYGA